MPLWIPYAGSWGLTGPTGIPLPPVGNSGTIVNSGTTGSKGSWTTIIGTGLSRPACGIWVRLLQAAASARVNKATLDVGIDYAGGTSFSVLIPDWLVGGSESGSYTGHWAWIPINIPEGATLGARVAHSHTTAVATRVVIVPSQFPVYPWMSYSGQYAHTYGVSGVDGTAVTPGNGTWGSWVAVGSTTTRPYRWWILGHQLNSSTTNTSFKVHEVAFGDASNKTTVGYAEWEDSTNEFTVNKQHYTGRACLIPEGVQLYVRGYASNANDTYGQVGLTLIG